MDRGFSIVNGGHPEDMHKAAEMLAELTVELEYEIMSVYPYSTYILACETSLGREEVAQRIAAKVDEAKRILAERELLHIDLDPDVLNEDNNA